MHTEWRCDRCGTITPLHLAGGISAELVATVVSRVSGTVRADGLPLWCPWPLLPGWTVTGVAWAGDERSGPKATALALSGPAPLSDGPADMVIVAEDLGVGLGNSLGGIEGSDPGPLLRAAVERAAPHAKLKAAGHPTPLWAVPSGPDRSAYVGEARGVWLFAVTWPAQAGYLLAEEIQLHDLVESVPSELVFGAPSARLHPVAPGE
jgi:hypothetical protein